MMLIDVEAGQSTTICYGQVLEIAELGASISGDVQDGIWFTTGDGIFLPSQSNSGIFSTTTQYQPGQGDMANGSFTLILVSDDPDGNGPMVEVSDVVVVSFMSAPALACTSNINVSLAEACTQEVDIFMLVTNPIMPYDLYTIALYDEDNNEIPDNILNASHLGQVIDFVVGHACTGSTCSGSVSVFDYIPPFLNCVDIEVSCSESTDPDNLGLPIPFYANASPLDANSYNVTNLDACGNVVLTYFDDVDEIECITGHISMITRTWTATDESGNSSSCDQEILVTPLPLSAVVLPPSLDDISGPSLECGGDWVALDNGYPSPVSTGSPAYSGCTNIQATYTDNFFDICGGGFKIVRQWFVIDWCTTASLNHNQIIKVKDTQGPLFDCPEDLTIGTDAYSCGSTSILLDYEGLVSDCSSFTFSFGLYTLGGDDIASIYISGNTLANLPKGMYTLQYIATDTCGNTNSCETFVTVIDDTLPFAICDGFTKVSIGSNGFAQLYASSLDDGSFDNCGNISFKAAKMSDSCNWGLGFGSYVQFCCEEVGDTILVAFQVTDEEGLQNSCMVQVLIEDKLPPEIICPSDITLSCSFDFDDNDLSIFGSVVDGQSSTNPIIIEGISYGIDGYFTDNCGASVDENHVINLSCGAGSIVRTFTVIDAYGSSDVCTQTITFIADNPFTSSDISWPSNHTMNGCDTIQADPILTGAPTFSGDKCAQVASTYDDQYFYISGGACIKILREWTVIDWCQFDGNTGQGLWTYLQEIKLMNNIAPTFVECNDTIICSYDDACTSEQVTLFARANDDCTDSLLLHYEWKIDLGDNGSIDKTGQGITLSDNLVYGIHRIYFTVEDGCGNSTECDFELEIRDCKNPTPYCNSSITTTLMPSSGEITIWASDFDFGSYDNCTDASDLKFSFSTDINDVSRTITCDDIENGIAAEITLEMWVTDEWGNQDRCAVSYIVQDNSDVCPDGTIKGKISGNIVTQKGSVVPATELSYACVLESYSGFEYTDTAGIYEITPTPEFLSYTLKPYYESSPNGGVSTLDLVMTQQHILGIKPFDNPYDIIAADVTFNKRLTSSDLLTMRKMILGVINVWPDQNSAWTFVDASYVFPDTTMVHEYPDSIIVSTLKDTMQDVDFVAVKIGDVNTSYKIPGILEEKSSEVRKNQAVELVFTKGENTWQAQIKDMDGVAGFQLSLELPNDAVFSSQVLQEDDYLIVGNELRIAWAPEILQSNDIVLFEIATSDMISISTFMDPEVYVNYEVYPMEITFVENSMSQPSDSNVSIIENPFRTALELTFQGDVTSIEIYDISGRLLMSSTIDYRQRYLSIDGNRFTNTGVYFMRIITPYGQELHKIIKI